MKKSTCRCKCNIENIDENLKHFINEPIPVNYNGKEIGKMDKDGNVILNENAPINQIFSQTTIGISLRKCGEIGEDGTMKSGPITEASLIKKHDEYDESVNRITDDFQKKVLDVLEQKSDKNEHIKIGDLVITPSGEVGIVEDIINIMLNNSDYIINIVYDNCGEIKKSVYKNLFNSFKRESLVKLDINLDEKINVEWFKERRDDLLERLNDRIKSEDSEERIENTFNGEGNEFGEIDEMENDQDDFFIEPNNELKEASKEYHIKTNNDDNIDIQNIQWFKASRDNLLEKFNKKIKMGDSKESIKKTYKQLMRSQLQLKIAEEVLIIQRITENKFKRLLKNYKSLEKELETIYNKKLSDIRIKYVNDDQILKTEKQKLDTVYKTELHKLQTKYRNDKEILKNGKK